MDIAVVYAALRTAVTNYAATVNAWSQGAYSKNHTFLDRLDRRKGPEESDCPCTDVMVLSKTMSQEARRQTSQFAVSLAVTDRTSAYFTNIEAYRKHLQDAIMTYLNTTDYELVDININFDSDNFFPVVVCTMEFNILERITIGQNPIE